MNVAAVVLWMFALVLGIFGLVFTAMGASSERGYWSQRDPSGNARQDATKISAIAKRTWHYAAGEYRAPLRIMAIGILLIELAVIFAVIALIVTIVA